MAYKITPYTRAQAKRLGVVVKPSKREGKKLDVYKGGRKVATIGALGMGDYPTFMLEEKKGMHPKGFANQRRKAYKARHQSNRSVRGSNGWYADQLLG